ncbi:Hypothetical protein GSB_155167 [Giardia duodenalis]|uniref:Uncharacterized protein n=1 Tax=Giardia intestinalis TaxID=5741 RepID=V6TMK3_GIAIN|nr:Hypothetical protein GSB_155167 [Giardia intestinalis]
MSETEYEIIFGNPFDSTGRSYRNPYVWEDDSVSSTSSSSMMLADEEEEWERGQALRERARRRRRRLRHYHSLTRKFKVERSEAAKELFDMIGKCEKLEKRLDSLVERFQALTYEKLDAERRAYNAQAELDELRGLIKNPPSSSQGQEVRYLPPGQAHYRVRALRAGARGRRSGQGRAFPLSYLKGAL